MAKVKPTKEERKAAKAVTKAASKQRRKQVWQAFQMQRKEDKALVPLMIATLVGVTAVLVLIGALIGSLVMWASIPIGLMIGAMAAFALFGRRVQNSVYKKADGTPGAAAWALDNLKGAWRVTSAVAATTQMDAVHRVIGRPGVILVGEGAPQRLKPLMAQEKKRTGRLIGDTPIYEFIVGNEEGQVPLRKLQRTLTKLPKNIDTKTLDAIEGRMNALKNKSAGPAMPKGPMPAGAKQKGMQRTMRRRGGSTGE